MSAVAWFWALAGSALLAATYNAGHGIPTFLCLVMGVACVAKSVDEGWGE